MLGGAAVEDIISHGDDRPPGGTRRRLLVAAALAVVVALVIAEHLPHGHRAAQPGHVANGRGTRQRSFSIRIRADGPAMLPPIGISGDVVPWTASARVPRNGTQPDWFWPAMGRVAPILGLPPDPHGYLFTRLDGGWAIQPNSSGLAGCAHCTGPVTRVFYVADRAQRAVMVGSASVVAPAAVKGQMWLTTYPSRSPGVAQLYNESGARIGAATTLPAGYGIIHGTLRGLLLETLSQGAPVNTGRLWNPATRKVTRTFEGVVAVSAAAVAYAPPCAATCPVHVFKVASGREVTIKMRPTDTVTSGVFSPDGRFLALQVSRGNGEIGDGGASAIQVDVASAATGRVVVVPHLFVSGDALAALGWPGSRDDLVAEFSFDGAVQMVFWDPAAGGSVAVADIKPTEDPAALVVG